MANLITVVKDIARDQFGSYSCPLLKGESVVLLKEYSLCGEQWVRVRDERGNTVCAPAEYFA